MAGNIGKVMHDAKDMGEKAVAALAEAMKLSQRLNNGRHYLMGIRTEDFTVEDCLEDFGYTRDGLADLK